MYTATVTQKGQITIPLKLREDYGLRLYGKVKIMPGDGYIKVAPEEDILDLAGRYVAKKGQSALKARVQMEKKYRRF